MKKGNFLNKGHQKFHTSPISTLFLNVLHKNKALHKFCKRGQPLIVKRNISLTRKKPYQCSSKHFYSFHLYITRGLITKMVPKAPSSIQKWDWQRTYSSPWVGPWERGRNILIHRKGKMSFNTSSLLPMSETKLIFLESLLKRQYINADTNTWI